MFELTIGGVVYPFNFGVGFLREINKTEKVTSNGVTRDLGFQMKVAALLDGDVLALVDILDAGNKGQSPRLTKKAIEGYIEDPDTDIDALFEDVLDFLTRNNATRKSARKAVEVAEEAMEKAKG